MKGHAESFTYSSTECIVPLELRDKSHHDNTQLPILGKNKWMGMDIDNKITTIANNNDKTHQWDIYNTL